MSSILDTVENLTQRKYSEKLVSKNPPSQIIRKEGICDYLNVGVIVFDSNQRCSQINLKAAEILGVSCGDIIGLTIVNILNDYFDTPITKELLTIITSNGHEPVTVNCVPLVRTDEGFDSVYVDLNFQPLMDGQGEYLGSVLTIVNISHHQAKVRELEKNKGLLVGLLDNTSNVIYAKDLDGKIILINTQYEKIFNLKKEDVIRKIGCADFLPQEIVEKVRDNDIKVIQSGQVIRFEEEIPLIDGTHSYLSTKFPLKDSNGEIFGLGGISTDITDIKYSERLNESLNDILSFIHTSYEFDTIMQKIFIESAKALGVDRGCITLLEGNNWVPRYGYGAMQDLVGHTFQYEELSISKLAANTKKIIVIEDCDINKRSYKSYMTKFGVKSGLIFPLMSRGEVIGVLSYYYTQTKKFTLKEIDYTNKLGSAISLALENAYHRENLERLVEERTNELRKANTKLKQEIKEKKRVEEELRSSEQRFAKAFNSNPNLMSIKYLKDGKYLEVNDIFLNATGYKLEEVLGKSDVELNLITSEESKLVNKLIKENNEVSNHAFKLRTKDGQIKDGLMSIGIIDVNGEECLLSVTKDVTEHNRLVRELSRLDQLNLVGEMAAGIGHEIRNPMTTARGFLQMLGTKDECKNYKEYFDLIIEELDRANSIITEYLSMAKDKAVELKENNLNSIITVISSLINADAFVYDKHLKLDLKDIPSILIDEKEIRQLIFNLSRNGFEAMEPGGILTISTELKDNQVVLAVRDNGKGIEPKILAKLGTPFFTTKDSGTGLGLAVCYSIAARHGAKINIETSPKGSTFFVKFPMSKTNP